MSPAANCSGRSSRSWRSSEPGNEKSPRVATRGLSYCDWESLLSLHSRADAAGLRLFGLLFLGLITGLGLDVSNDHAGRCELVLREVGLIRPADVVELLSGDLVPRHAIGDVPGSRLSRTAINLVLADHPQQLREV